MPVTSTVPDPLVFYSAQGEYAVQLIAFYGIYSDTLLADSFIVVNPLPAVVLDYQNGVLACTGDTAELYTWYLDGEVLSNDSGATFTPLVSGDYSVEVLVPNGCAAMSNTVFVEVSTGLPDSEPVQGVRLYPNPAWDEIRVEATGRVVAFTVANALGAIVQRGSVSGGTRIQVPLGRLCAGAYVIGLEYLGGGREVLRFVKE